jgi:hypothetical protein
MTFSLKDQEAHDSMLRTWVKTLQGSGYVDLSASLPEYVSKPQSVAGGSIPDLTARDPRNQRVIGEVKVSSDVDNAHTRGQLQDYLRTGSKVMLLVPASYLESTKRTLQSWNIGSVEVWSHSGT